MRIGLVRHFKVDLYRSRFMTSREYNEHMYNYDRAEVIPNELVIDKDWDKCYCSSMPRAITTARTIYHGDMIITDKLVEIPAAAWLNLNIKLPYYLWAVLARFAWMRNHFSQPEGRIKTLKRINEILNVILSENEKDSNILIVSHAGTLYEIKKLLRKKGFKGEGFLKASNGRLYVYER
ncbi:histidine phosphatase family protein [Clostridium sp. SYSU_GA19001]|uniref:phosphoglycerate mutase family protein n=1 Tax=Clostridium caldaquaticum TaxID=2940653 RepID=UPI0020772C38|nr:histidine phosphatase family protein [Clostridium caldaquaticum]MCM8711442.1 histidine phosphatase family protein [Clostridium caldaquaticum]